LTRPADLYFVVVKLIGIYFIDIFIVRIEFRVVDSRATTRWVRGPSIDIQIRGIAGNSRGSPPCPTGRLSKDDLSVGRRCGGSGRNTARDSRTFLGGLRPSRARLWDVFDDSLDTMRKLEITQTPDNEPRNPLTGELFWVKG
jgi:hypothetical protein